MRKIIVILTFCISVPFFMWAQSLDELRSINARSKVQYVKPETLDQLMIGLRQYENTPLEGQDSVMLDTYRSVAAGYMGNNHYKQAYDVYNRYLRYMENILSEDKSAAISKAVNSVYGRQRTDQNEKTDLDNQVNKLQAENDSLSSKRFSFKRNFSFALIILSAIFAVMLVSAGIRMVSLQSRLRQSRDKMKSLHRISVAGNYETGISSSLKSSLTSIDSQTKDLQQDLKKYENFAPAKEAIPVAQKIEKILREIKP